MGALRSSSILILDLRFATASPQHTNLQVVDLQRRTHTSTCPITEVSSRVWCILSHSCIFYKRLCFCVLQDCREHCSMYLYFKPRTLGSKQKKKKRAAGIQGALLRSISCCIALLYFSRYSTVRLKMFYCFLSTICVNIINVLQYSTT